MQRASAPEPGLASLTPEERAWLRAHPVISVGVDPNWPPIEFRDDTGKCTGLALDYLDLVQERLGVKFEKVCNSNWSETVSRLKRWELDMTVAVAVTTERMDFWSFTKPYMRSPIVILARSDVNLISDMRRLFGKTLAVEDGNALCEWLSRDYPDIELVKVRNTGEGLEMLRQGRVFAYMDNMLVSSYFLTRLRMTDIKIAGETPYVNMLSMAVRKDWAIFAGILDKALESIPEAERESLYQKWVPIRYEHGFDYGLLWQVLGGFILIVLALLFWNRRLSREIGRRRKAELALVDSETRMRTILDNVGAYVFMKDTRHRYTYVNDKVCELFGLPEREILGKGDEAFFSAESAAEILQNELAVIERGEILDREEKAVVLSGEAPRIYWTSKIPLRDSSGGIYALCGVSTDITERKRAEEAQAQLRAQFHQAQKMESVGRLAGGVAHDFNNMLGIILGYTEMALEYVDPEHPQHPLLMEIRKAAERSAHLTHQLLAFARKQTVAPRVLDLNEIVEGTLNMLRRLIGEDIDLLWIPGGGLRKVKVDPSQIDQILANLCVNARDAIAGVGKLTIETGNVEFDEQYCAAHAKFVPGEYVRLTIADSGCGMDGETMERLFEPFFTTKETGRGTGLGLSTVYGIVRQNDGFVNVYSEPGRGTVFNVYLPCCDDSAGRERREGPVESMHRGTETILLVEDEPSILSLVVRVLEGQGYEVLASSSPEEALRLAGTHPGEIHLLMSDVVMPGMNGRELAEKILAFHPAIKSLFMSGYTADVIAHHGVLDPGVHFIQKPFSRRDIASKVRQALERSNA